MSVTGSAAYSPRPTLQLRIVPGAYSTVRDSERADVYRLAFEGEHRIAGVLALRAAYEINSQQGVLNTAVPLVRISRRLMTVSVIVQKRTREPVTPSLVP